MSDATTVMTGGQVAIEMLRRFGVDMMFGLPGDQTHLYDALYAQADIKHVLIRHEQAAAHMADAYARSTGKVGVCDASIGPGATNLISGISEAFTSGIPVVALVSDVRSDWRGRDSFQEVDQVKVFEPITKRTFLVDHTVRIPELMARAFQIATTGRPGPVLLSFPIDVLRRQHTFSPEDLAVDARYGRFPPVRMTPPVNDIETAVAWLLQSERPVIVAGGGVLASGAMAEVEALADLLDIPVATTFMGKGTIAESHPLSAGTLGVIGRPVTNDYVLQADLALALGTRFTNVDTVAWRVPAEHTRLIQIDVEPTQIGRNKRVDLPLPGDVRAVLTAMMASLHAQGVAQRPPVQRQAVASITDQWRKEKGIESPLAVDDDTSPVHPLQVIRALRHVMGDEDTIICDSGFNQIWGGQYFEVGRAGRYYIGPRGFGVMGFSLPASIAHALAHPERRVVALCGDGGFAMVMQELETALRVNADITVCIVNNSNLQFIRDNQRLLFDSRFISTDFTELDYAGIARAFGCAGIRVDRSGDLESALDQALSNGRPTVVDVRVDGEVVPDRTSLQTLG